MFFDIPVELCKLKFRVIRDYEYLGNFHGVKYLMLEFISCLSEYLLSMIFFCLHNTSVMYRKSQTPKF